ncbi:MAG: hypothetical protein ACHBN1_21120 [Heteroscytonema crispum UTEX LB 1556]
MYSSLSLKIWEKLADEVEKWGNWVIEKVREEIGDLYPAIDIQPHNRQGINSLSNSESRLKPTDESSLSQSVETDLSYEPRNLFIGGIGDDNESVQLDLFSQNQSKIQNPKSKIELTPVAYLWTRTVRCPNPACGAAVLIWFRKSRK